MVEELKEKPDPVAKESRKPWRVEIDSTFPASGDIMATRYFWTERRARKFAQTFLELWGDDRVFVTRAYLLHKTEPPGARPLQVNTGKNKLKPRRRD